MTLGVEEAIRGAEPEGALARPVLRRALAVLVLAAWVAWAVPSWMSSLHEVRAHELAADVRAGRVTGFQMVTNVRPDVMGFFSLGSAWYADVPAADAEGRPTVGLPGELIYLVDGEVRMRWLAESASVVGDQDAVTALLDSGARPFTSETYPPNRDWAAYPAVLAVGLALAALVLLPPTRGTRPFWVLSATLGMGLGIVAYAAAELWWRASPSPDRASRLCWWHGVLVSVVVGLVVVALRAAIT